MMATLLSSLAVTALIGIIVMPAQALAESDSNSALTPAEKRDVFCEVLAHSNNTSVAPLLDITTEAGFMANWTLYVLLVLDEAACEADRSEQLEQTFERIDEHWTITPK